MPENADENAWSEAYQLKAARIGPVWRIRHPDLPYYVAFLVVSDLTPTTKRQLGLIRRDDGPPEEAMQFGRRRDAEQFARACLTSDIAWLFEGPATPPAWSESAP